MQSNTNKFKLTYQKPSEMAEQLRRSERTLRQWKTQHFIKNIHYVETPGGGILYIQEMVEALTLCSFDRSHSDYQKAESSFFKLRKKLFSQITLVA